VPVSMMFPPKVSRSTMAAQSRGSVKVFVQPPKLSLEAMATLFFSSRGTAVLRRVCRDHALRHGTDTLTTLNVGCYICPCSRSRREMVAAAAFTLSDSRTRFSRKRREGALMLSEAIVWPCRPMSRAATQPTSRMAPPSS
jgi:hypothetical protein